MLHPARAPQEAPGAYAGAMRSTRDPPQTFRGQRVERPWNEGPEQQPQPQGDNKK
jgi:hypothetical protein